jgi:hypothetical protein
MTFLLYAGIDRLASTWNPDLETAGRGTPGSKASRQTDNAWARHEHHATPLNGRTEYLVIHF